MVDIHDYDIELVEEEILMKFETNPSNYEDCDCLLSLRKDMINKRVLAQQEEILPDIMAFNETEINIEIRKQGMISENWSHKNDYPIEEVWNTENALAQ